MREKEIRAMIEALQQIQEARYLSTSGMARMIGCSTAHLSMIYSGSRRPGLRFVRAVMRRFPDIRRLIAESLQEDDPQNGSQ